MNVSLYAKFALLYKNKKTIKYIKGSLLFSVIYYSAFWSKTSFVQFYCARGGLHTWFTYQIVILIEHLYSLLQTVSLIIQAPLTCGKHLGRQKSNIHFSYIFYRIKPNDLISITWSCIYNKCLIAYNIICQICQCVFEGKAIKPSTVKKPYIGVDTTTLQVHGFH